MKKIWFLMILVMILNGCGRIVNLTGGEEEIEIIKGRLYQQSQFLVNGLTQKGDQKNPTILKYDENNLLVFYVNEDTFRIHVSRYDANMVKVNEFVLLLSKPLTHGRAGVTRHGNGYLVCWDSESIGYMGYFDLDGKRLMDDIVILDNGGKDIVITSLSDELILIVYEIDNPDKKDVYSRVYRLVMGDES